MSFQPDDRAHCLRTNLTVLPKYYIPNPKFKPLELSHSGYEDIRFIYAAVGNVLLF